MSENKSQLPSSHNEPAGWQKKTALFLSSQNLSMFGSMLVQYAIIWHITLTTQSGATLTIATIASFLPQILISLFAGVWADRYNKKFLIIASDALTAISTLVLALFFLYGYRELWLIYLVSGIRSIGSGIQAPAVNALLPRIVPVDRLMKVNSINSTIQPFIMIISPVLAGALMSIAPLEVLFFIDTTTAALAIGLMLLLQVPHFMKSNSEQAASYLTDLKAGIAYINCHRPIRRLFVFFGITFFLITPVVFLTPLLVTRSFGDEVWRLTANEVTFFGGSILGGVIMTWWGGFSNRFRTIGLSCVVWGLLFAALGLSRSFPIYLLFMVLSGIPMPFFNATTITLLQEMVKPDLHGRVFGVQGLITNIVMPVGMLIFGPLADRVSIELLMVITSVLMLIPALWIFFYDQSTSRQDLEEQYGNC